MRTFFVAVSAPIFHLFLGVRKAEEPVGVEAAAIKRFNRLWRARSAAAAIESAYSKRAAMKAGRYAHVQHSKRHRQLILRVRGWAALSARPVARSQSSQSLRLYSNGRFGASRRAAPKSIACAKQALFLSRVRGGHRQGKASAPYEFGLKDSIVTTNTRARAATSC